VRNEEQIEGGNKEDRMGRVVTAALVGQQITQGKDIIADA
jgi:hypothetical protein